MPQPIVPLEIPQSRRFDSKKEMIFCLKLARRLEVSFFNLSISNGRNAFG